MDKVAVSRAVKRLITAGRVLRDFAKEDRRRSILTLSWEGRRIYEKVAPAAVDIEKKILDQLSVGEKEQLDALLKRLSEIRDGLED